MVLTKRWGILLLLPLLCVSGVRAELQIEINQGVENPTPIAVVPFAWQGVGSAPEDAAQIIDSDLARSGQFAPVSRRDMLSYPTRESELFFRDWRAISAEYVLIGRVTVGSQARIDFQLFDTTRQEAVESGTVTGPVSELRMLSHRVSDSVYETLTGIPGAFATRLLYVSVTRNPERQGFLSSDPCRFRRAQTDRAPRGARANPVTRLVSRWY